MTHKFDVNKKHKLDSPERREMLPIQTVLEKMNILQNSSLADIGCGIGYFTIPIAKVIGENGMVYALDVEPAMLEEVENRKKDNSLANIKTVLTQEYNLALENGAVSQTLICTVLHEIKDKTRFLKETNRILSDGGKIAIVEWIKGESAAGPPTSHRVGSNEVKQLLKECKFKDISIKELNEYFYIITATKSN